MISAPSLFPDLEAVEGLGPLSLSLSPVLWKLFQAISLITPFQSSLATHVGGYPATL